MKLTRLKSERPRREYDFYPTPYGLAETSLVNLIGEWATTPRIVLDAGAGDGVWGKAYRKLFGNRTFIDGIDIRGILPKPPEYNSYYKQDFLEFYPDAPYDLIMGNPPYSLMEEFVRHSMEIVKELGYVFFLGRLEFLASKKRGFGLFAEYPPIVIYVLSRRPSFFSTNGKKTTDAQDYAMYLWRKTELFPETGLEWLYWEYDEEND